MYDELGFYNMEEIQELAGKNVDFEMDFKKNSHYKNGHWEEVFYDYNTKNP